ncbi:rhombosortase-dependent M36 family metallopeptidase [Shewanella woodyi]|uniref:Protease-associated PA domain protein n=1 Tax=Shewanella woodyi (strain ATCC 51908 / MS32) TaxID=392500 RepID=B1KEL1_SHEWM|nr:rhombosortase-dependent M36 family metallopeptidase [Shewanella woodyi]ACA88026.1 protease-associated PA domain protein [Shewanella woodyi ATCC 51908]
MNFNKTVIATVIGTALAGVTLSATSGDLKAAPNYKSFDNAQVIKKQNQQINVATASGMSNQYDAQLGKTTFRWAGKSQSVPSLGAVSLENKVSHAADYYLGKLTGFSSSKGGVAQSVLVNTHDLGRGSIIAKYKQEVSGVEVFNREFNIMMDREFNLVASSGYFASQRAATTVTSAIKDIEGAFGDASESISAAFGAMGGDKNSVTLSAKPLNGKYEKFAVTNMATDKILVGEPRAKKVFFEHKNKLVAAHYVEIETGASDSRESEYFSYVISAKTGEILFKKNLTSHAADFNYRIYADEDGKPWDSPHGNVMPAPEGSDVDAYLTAPYLDAPMVALTHGPISTMDPWLADDATSTMGNNVTAYVDAIAPQGLTNGDYLAETTSSNTFDYKYDDSEAEYSVNNRKAAIVNLFLMNNYLHDDYYDHGFDEAAGNAQTLNYDRGGVEGDALNVEVQDNSGFNNANMSTPADGGSPRMQMYLWETTQAVNGVDFGVTATSHASIGMLEDLGFAGFGPDVFEVSGDLVRLVDATDPVNDGCEAATNAAELAGKIAIIDRGACNFTQKVKNAQDAGSIAVIIANNRDGDATITMGGSDDTITIPSMMVSQNEGAAIYALLDADETVTVDMFKNDLSRVFKDSSWDNAIVAHEWGHYISNRLVGNGSGLSSNQARSMGEGFGDFHALLFGSEEADNLVTGNENYAGSYGDTTYVASFVNGIRQFPYSTNMDINPSTFAYVESNPQVHASGSVYGVMLWDAFIGLVNDERHTFDEAKDLMKDYLVAGYKMMPMAPTFTEGRDALLAAAYANDEDDYKVILGAFARRGMGLGAKSPSRFSTDHADVVESYKTDLATYTVAEHELDTNYEGMTVGYCSSDNILDKGETGTVSFTIQNGGNQALTGLTGEIVVESDHDVTFANDGMVTFDDVALFGSTTSSPIEFTLNEAATGDELVLKFVPELAEGMEADEYMLSTIVNVDFETRELVGSTQYEDLNTLSRLNDFTETVIVGGEMAKGTFGLDQWDDTDGLISGTGNSFTSDVGYETRPTSVGFDGEFTVSFWHLYNLETGYDGAVVEVSVNGGDWVDVTDMGATFAGDGYTDTGLDNTEAAIAGRSTFSGFNYGAETINFGESLNGNQVQFRFRIATDSAVVPDPVSGFASGWYIDDITFTNTQTSLFSDVVAGDTFACDNRLPSVTTSASAESVNEGQAVTLTSVTVDPNANDTHTYAWTQTSGTSATLTGADTSQVSFTAPDVSGDETLEFSVTVNDGTGDVVSTVSVQVKDIPEVVPPKEPLAKGSGGSTGLLTLLLLPLALLRRK